MTIVHDMSDKGLVAQFGDVMHELPELYEALRRFEIESRPAKSGFKMSVQSRSSEFRLRVGDTRSVK